jgi:hypothetical protein
VTASSPPEWWIKLVIATACCICSDGRIDLHVIRLGLRRRPRKSSSERRLTSRASAFAQDSANMRAWRNLRDDGTEIQAVARASTKQCGSNSSIRCSAASENCGRIAGIARPGDVIATGTPEGVGPFSPGNRLRIEIEGVGTMTVTVREAERIATRPF